MEELLSSWKVQKRRLVKAKALKQLVDVELLSALKGEKEAATLLSLFFTPDNDNRQACLPPPTPENTPDAS